MISCNRALGMLVATEYLSFPFPTRSVAGFFRISSVGAAGLAKPRRLVHG